MDYQEILLAVKLMPPIAQARLISDLLGQSQDDYLSLRREQLYDKQASCPRCEGKEYFKYGTDKGSQRFKCKECGRTFTEFTGTWLDGLHKKSQVVAYIQLMIEGKSLDKISALMHINKKTAFDWRHKILSSLKQDSGEDMEGIIESDETFFEESAKGDKDLNRPARKRGSSSSKSGKKKRGISDNKLAVIATVDRKGAINLCASTMGRIGKDDIIRSIEKPLPSHSILCTDGHISYKGFALDSNIKHVALRADLNQYVKQGVYHIQNVNSIHNRLKKWIDNTFWGVSTKYMQNYLGWFRLREKLKGSVNTVKDFMTQTVHETEARKRYEYINVSYQWLLATQK